MKVSKLLYVADRNECDLSSCVMQRISFFNEKGCSQIIFFKVNPSQEQVEALSQLSINSKVLTDHEKSPEDIVTAAERENASLILINTDQDLEESAFDSVIKKLMEISPIPLLITKKSSADESPDKKLFTHTIFATDWSPSSQKALKYLFGYKDSMSTLEVIHVINDKLTVKDLRVLKERLEETRKSCLNEGIDAEAHIYAGKTWEEIVRASKEYRGTIITLGKGTRKSFWKSLFKEKSLINVIREAPVPVLVVP